LLASSAALGSTIFPVVIAMTLAPSKTPPCTICHATDSGGTGTVVQPFGRKVMGYGLKAGDTQTLITIINMMRDSQEDTDGDKNSDTDEIKAGTNPNINDITGQPAAEDYPPPVYGCQASGARNRMASNSLGWPFAGVALLTAMWVRSRVPRRRLIHASRKEG
jgi:hypothetical protein